MKLRTAVAIFVVLVLGLFVALSVSLVRITDLLDRSGRDLAMAGEKIRLAEELKSSLLTHNRNAFLYSLHREPSRMATRRAQRTEIVALLQTINLLSSNKAEEPVLAELSAEMEDYFELRDQLRGSGIPAVEQYNRISRNVDDATVVADRLIDFHRSQMRVLMENIRSRNSTAAFTAVTLLSLGSITLLCLLGAVFVFAARPLQKLTQTVASYGAGDNTARAGTKGLAEIREIAVNFNAMADRLEERRQEQLRFLASIAHDLRNPLHSIALVSELLVHKSAEEDRELAKVVLRQVSSLDHLVQDLLDTSRIEAGQMALQPAEHDLNSLIRDAAELHGSGAEMHEIELALPDEPIVCRYDHSRLSQVLNNLLSNAIKYSPDGGVVKIEAHKEAEQVRVSVSDEGIGIAPEDLGNIFKPFHRTAATKRTIPGIGLGLSASRRIVEAHGGVLVVESTPNQGSTFHIIIPCQSDTARRPPETLR